jgi:hypothetical protein
MNKRLLTFLFSVLLIAHPLAAFSEDLSDSSDLAGLTHFEELTGPGFEPPPPWSQNKSCATVVTPSVRMGYCRPSINVNFPIRFDPASRIRPLDFSLLDTNAWFGAATLDIFVPPGMTLLASAFGIATDDVTALTGTEPLNAGAVQWTGSDLRWWALEGAVAYDLLSGVGLTLGLRHDRFKLNLSNPRNQGGPLIPTEVISYSGGLQTNLWIPYLGLHLTGRNFRARLLGSPYTFADLKAPLGFSVVPGDFNDLKYSIQKPGGFFEGDLQFVVNPCRAFGFGVWGTGNWLLVSGEGKEEFQETGPAPLGPLTAEAQSTFTRSVLSAGVLLQARF